MTKPQHAVRVDVRTEYLPGQSDPAQQRWVFAYHITLINEGTERVKLLTRHWVITDGNERVQEVHGEGVIGEQPSLAPGEHYSYTSGTILETEVGTMQGSYQMISESGDHFDAPIAPFTLAVPRAIH